MINWTEEDVKFIAENIVTPCMQALVDVGLKHDDLSYESYKKIFDVLAHRIRELDYERQKDKSFFLQLCGSMHHYPLSVMQDEYNRYCEAYDRLNKHLLDDKEEVNEA